MRDCVSHYPLRYINAAVGADGSAWYVSVCHIHMDQAKILCPQVFEVGLEEDDAYVLCGLLVGNLRAYVRQIQHEQLSLFSS